MLHHRIMFEVCQNFFAMAGDDGSVAIKTKCSMAFVPAQLLSRPINRSFDDTAISNNCSIREAGTSPLITPP